MSIKKRFFGICFFISSFTTICSNAQVGISEVSITPNASSVLELRSTTKGFLAPRMTSAQKDAISSPATGLTIYQTDGTTGYYIYSGSGWIRMITSTVSISDGGTGASTKSAAFDNLSPMTASGDIIYGGNAGTGTRLGKGTDGQVLTLTSGLPSWQSPSSSVTLTSGVVTTMTNTSMVANSSTFNYRNCFSTPTLVAGTYLVTFSITVDNTVKDGTAVSIRLSDGTNIYATVVTSNAGSGGDVTVNGASTSAIITLSSSGVISGQWSGANFKDSNNVTFTLKSSPAGQFCLLSYVKIG